MIHLHELIAQYYPQYHTIEHYPADMVVPIRKSSDEWGILGNMTKCPLTIDGVTFPSSEHVFHIMKFTDTAIRRELLSDPSAYSMKRFKSKRYSKAGLERPDWASVMIDAMKYVLTVKYAQSEMFRSTLHRTDNLFILEDETARMRGKAADSWGAVISKDGSEYVGPNLLGRLLMELRKNNGILEYHLPDGITSFFDMK